MERKEQITNTPAIEELKKQFSRLSGILLERTIGKDPEKNTVFSPYSVFSLLALAADASAGQTRDEITNALLDGTDFDHTLEALKDVRKDLIEGKAFTDATAVIIRKDKKSTINPGYPDHLRQSFDGKMFSTENMVTTVNNWVCRKSKGMIPVIADNSMKEMLLCLVNACSFIAKWQIEYRKTDIQNMDFHNRDGSVSRVKALHSYEDTYIENEQFIGFAKPYKGEQFSYMVLLPKEGLALKKELLSTIDYSALLKGTENMLANVLMPEFIIDSDYDLTSLCREMGIRSIFTPDADLSPVSSEWLMAEGIRHKAHIKVDREGTKAAAVTATSVFAGFAPCKLPETKEVYVDRPFLYAIVHHETGLPVFVGTVNHLEPYDGEDRLTNAEKESLCEQIYDSILRRLKVKNGSEWVNADDTFYNHVEDAYSDLNLDALMELKAELNER